MRKLRKGERYALWRGLANTLNKYIKRSLLRNAHRDDVESGRGVQIKVDLSKSYGPFKAIYKGKYNSSRTLFCFVLALSYMLFSDAQAQSAGERAAEGLEESHIDGKILVGYLRSAATAHPIEAARVTLIDSDNTVFSDRNGQFKLTTKKDSGNVRIDFHGYEPITFGFSNGEILASRSVFYLKRDLSAVVALTPGNELPDELWDLPLSVINHPDDRSQITLREYKDNRLLILDFWTYYCSPCIKSVDHWEETVKLFPDIALLTVHVDIVDRAIPLIKQRGWKAPVICGEAHRLINHYFFKDHQLGGVVLIANGKLLAVPKNKEPDFSKLETFLKGGTVDFGIENNYAHEREGL